LVLLGDLAEVYAELDVEFYVEVYLATLPPLALQSFSDISIQPLPLQPFWPEQPLVAVEQALFPLHEFTPWQWTLAESAAEAASGAPALKSPAAIAAMIAPLFVMGSPLDPPLLPRNRVAAHLSPPFGRGHVPPRVDARRLAMSDKKTNTKAELAKEEAAANDLEVDESSDESFPASDPPSWTLGRNAQPPEVAHRQADAASRRPPVRPRR
jgi:hypothetical protein